MEGIRMQRYFKLFIGIVFILSPFLLYWFIHGDYERYIWIIKGPYPFSHFGSGPAQLFMYVCLFLIGIGFLFATFIQKRKTK